MQRLNHLWRWCGTALSFFLFGLGGILLPLFAVPVLYCLPGSERQRQRRGQRLIHRAFRFYVGLMKFLGVLSYEIEGAEKLRGAQLVIANHPSLIDVIFLVALIPNANCVVKGKLVSNPFTRGPIRTAGYIINQDSEKVIQEASRAFARGDALIIFPEGTRSVPGESLRFKRGAANVAIRAAVDLTPVLISCKPTTLTKADRWYQVPKLKVRIRICVRDSVAVAPYLQEKNPSVAARKLTSDLVSYFEKELVSYE